METSRRHAELVVTDERALITDLKSRNGTFVNGKQVSRATLEVGDIVRAGDIVTWVTRGRGDSAPQPRVSSIARGFWVGSALLAKLAPLRSLATTTLPILIQGETGVGKERVAKAIHEWSGRSGSFVGVNCAAIPEQLAEAELFGYRRGAFTGAEQGASGHFRAANRGTVFLDEVSDLPANVQAKLLRVLEEREVQELGESKPTAVDVRVIAASRIPLVDQVALGKFRPDLYNRLNGYAIEVPPLSARKEEIPSLFVEFIESQLRSSAPSIESILVERLLLYRWPGNVRELALLVQRLLGLHAHEGCLRLRHLQGTPLERHPETPAPAVDEPATLPRDERDTSALLLGLRKFDGNLAQAALFANISRQRAYRLLSQQADVDLDALRKGKG